MQEDEEEDGEKKPQRVQWGIHPLLQIELD